MSPTVEKNDSPDAIGVSTVAKRPEKPWLALLLRWQETTNVLASVAIEVPALRPILEKRVSEGG